MRKIAFVAQREFLATVLTKGFIIGVLMVPVMMTVVVAVMPRLMTTTRAPVRGRIVLIDQSGEAAADVKAALDPEAIEARRTDATRRALSGMPTSLRGLAGAAESAGGQSVVRALGEVPEFEIVEREADADLQAEKAALKLPRDRGRPLGIVVIHRHAVTRDEGQSEYGTYDFFAGSNLDDRVESAVYDGVREALITARARSRKLDRAQLETIMRVPRPRSVTVTADSESRSARGLNQAIPFIFVAVLMFGVMMGGQSLLTTTVEEKSSRVMEVLLSAVSPLELMAGKIIGQFAVSLTVMGLYIGAGMVLLISFALIGLLDMSLLVYLGIFFVITYLIVGSIMVAVGAAVNEMQEAQSLLMPVMLTLVAPWLLASPLIRDPNSTWAVALSFVPPINSFVMLLRMTSNQPPPLWQVWLTILIGIAAAGAAVWAAAKVFRIGLLMHGKPPNMATMIRWVRQA